MHLARSSSPRLARLPLVRLALISLAPFGLRPVGLAPVALALFWPGAGAHAAAQEARAEPRAEAAETAAAAEAELPWPMQIVQKQDGPGGSLFGTTIELWDRRHEGSAEDRALLLDFLGTDLGFLGAHDRQREVEAQRLTDLFPNGRPGAPVDEERASLLEPRPALDAIVAAARDSRVLMLNEEHHSSEQRAFLLALLPALRSAGFTHLACEAFRESIVADTAAGFPTASSGYYLQDPYFADAVRQALALGFTLVPCEAEPGFLGPREGDTQPLDATNRREGRQAERLAQLVAAHPDARLVVYAGRHHIAEEGTDDGWQPMAAQFKARAGLDPVTVDLMLLCEQALPTCEAPMYRWLTAHDVLRDEPVILFEPGGAPWQAFPGIDLFAALPRATWKRGRPDALRWHTGRVGVPLVLGDVPRDRPLLVRARVAGESDAAVPLDQVIVWPGGEVPELLLRPGRYRIEVVDPAGLVRRSTELTVAA